MARRRTRYPGLSFKAYCRLLGVTPRQRILLTRYFKKHLKEVSRESRPDEGREHN